MVTKDGLLLDWKTLIVIALSLGVLTLVAVQAQQRTTRTPPVPTLTAADYLQIQQLVARYSYALDTGANDGFDYADLFAPGGSFGSATTREQLAATARPGGGHYPRGPQFVFHYTSNHVIEASPEGATGKVYVVEIDAGEKVLIEDGGHYEDVYVKTPQGWRFKSRTFIKTKPGTPPVNPRPPR
ncbi:MAG: nuclear transport factor 2 family protein [Acidobacteriota bacterium]